MIAPLSGEIIEVNEALEDAPEQINEDPYGEGWLVKVRLVRRRPRPTSLMDADDATRASLSCEPLHLRHRRRPARRCSTRIGVGSIDELFADVPEGVRLGRALDLPPGKPEQEVYALPARPRRAQRLRRGRAHASSAPGCTTTTSRR